MERFRVQITDLKTGKKEIDVETNCLIGAVNEGDGTRRLFFAETNAINIANAMIQVETLFEINRNRFEGINKAYTMLKKVGMEEETE